MCVNAKISIRLQLRPKRGYAPVKWSLVGRLRFDLWFFEAIMTAPPSAARGKLFGVLLFQPRSFKTPGLHGISYTRSCDRVFVLFC